AFGFSGVRRLLANGDIGGLERVGDVWLRAHAGISLGNFSGGAGCESADWIWGSLREGSVAANSGRAPFDAAAADCYAGRYRAGLGRAAAIAGAYGAFALRSAKYISGECGRGAASLGD